MKVGMMNDPRRDIIEQARLCKRLGMEYFEVTIEAPEATPEKVIQKRKQIADFGLPIVAHMPWYLQISSPYRQIRQAMVEVARQTIETAADLEAPYITIHPDYLKLKRPNHEILDLTVESISILSEASSDAGVRLCLENAEREYMPIDILKKVFESVDGLGFTLDVGHAFIGVGDTRHITDLMVSLRDRLAHVHIHDNFGHRDDHLPLGVGKIDYPQVLRELKKTGYDGNITIEDHAHDKEYLETDRIRLLKAWNS